MNHEVVEGIVLQRINYSETSLILKLLTEKEGVRSFIFPGGKSKKKNGNLLLPLSVVQLTCTHKPNQQLAQVNAVDVSVVLREIPFNPYKSGILFFMNEVVAQTVREQEDNEGLFNFLKQAIQILDHADYTANFPVKFLIQLTNYLGFYPKTNGEGAILDLREGTFVTHTPHHPMYIPAETGKIIRSLMHVPLDGTTDPRINAELRKKSLHAMLSYYKVIFDHFKDLRSLPVLEETFHD